MKSKLICPYCLGTGESRNYGSAKYMAELRGWLDKWFDYLLRCKECDGTGLDRAKVKAILTSAIDGGSNFGSWNPVKELLPKKDSK